jgi:hypothetical protein
MDVFRLRCAAAAAQVAAGLTGFHQAVDGLQTAAEAYGLVSKIGQDPVRAGSWLYACAVRSLARQPSAAVAGFSFPVMDMATVIACSGGMQTETLGRPMGRRELGERQLNSGWSRIRERPVSRISLVNKGLVLTLR